MEEILVSIQLYELDIGAIWTGNVDGPFAQRNFTHEFFSLP